MISQECFINFCTCRGEKKKGEAYINIHQAKMKVTPYILHPEVVKVPPLLGRSLVMFGYVLLMSPFLTIDDIYQEISAIYSFNFCCYM